METESAKDRSIPDECLENLIYIGYGGPSGIFAAYGEIPFLEGIISQSTTLTEAHWTVDVVIDPNQLDLPWHVENRCFLIPLLCVCVEEGKVYPNPNGPFWVDSHMRPPLYKPLTPEILQAMAVDNVQQAYAGQPGAAENQ